MSVSCQFNGRTGNILFNICQVLSYCRRYNLVCWFPEYAWACTGGRSTISIRPSGYQPINPYVYNEPVDSAGCPYYHEIPYMDNVEFRGYYQSFRYFDHDRDYILGILNIPYSYIDRVSISVRRGDCVSQPDAFPLAPMEYYHRAVEYMQQRGYNTFLVHSDDIPWCREEFTTERYPGAIFEFSTNALEDVMGDLISISSCAHNIIARSTLSLMAGWLNRNSEKIVLCPSATQQLWWRGQNLDLLTGTEHWLTQITW